MTGSDDSWRGKSQARRKRHRSIWAWAFVLWVVGLGVIAGWRGVILWHARTLLFELGSSLPPTTLTLFVSSFLLCGCALIASGLGLWLQRDWARQAARACIPLYALASQVYTWFFVRSGLMWERRWVSLAASALAVGIGIAVLTWHRSRKWLGVD